VCGVRVAQVLQHDAVARPVGELRIGLPAAGEVGIDLDAIADVGDEQERRPAMIDRQRLGIAFGLPLGLHHRLGPAGHAAPGGAALHTRGGGLAEKVKIVLAALRRRAIGVAAPAWPQR